MEEFIRRLFETNDWPARWRCGKWSDFHGWLYILSDVAIWAAYFAIPVIMLAFVLKRKEDIPFVRVFGLYMAFIVLCGTTHLMDALMFWYPAYRFNALLLFFTAIVSWATVIGLYRVMPKAIQLKAPAQYEAVLKTRTDALKTSSQQMTRLNRDLDNYIYAASHDLKSPINNLEGLLLVLETQLPDPDPLTREVLDRMEISLNRMKNTITALSDVIKIEKNPLDDVENNLIGELLVEIQSDNESLFRASNARLETHLETDRLTYSRTALKSILYNLVTNAIKYRSPERLPVVQVRTCRQGDEVVLQVSDNGLGIDLQRHGAKMFTIFKRFHDHVEGSGLGLHMVKRLVEDRGGNIAVESTVNKGTTFTITFKEATATKS